MKSDRTLDLHKTRQFHCIFVCFDLMNGMDFFQHQAINHAVVKRGYPEKTMLIGGATSS